ncbi:uncharacterized protein LOC121490521 [Vulpes lagopus]|uniref:uncharacterized protein LOC121490521 n=1 Tax=Vulpes lagopus TaxID=494514 RepID=UPI001BC98F24|nr:uncharacterized protein LOC121490521 [Vulpes lagopus]
MVQLMQGCANLTASQSRTCCGQHTASSSLGLAESCLTTKTTDHGQVSKCWLLRPPPATSMGHICPWAQLCGACITVSAPSVRTLLPLPDPPLPDLLAKLQLSTCFQKALSATERESLQQTEPKRRWCWMLEQRKKRWSFHFQIPDSLQPLLRVWGFPKSSFKAHRKGFSSGENPLHLSNLSGLQWIVQNGPDCKHLSSLPLGRTGRAITLYLLTPGRDLLAQTSRTTWQFPLTWRGFPFKL